MTCGEGLQSRQRQCNELLGEDGKYVICKVGEEKKDERTCDYGRCSHGPNNNHCKPRCVHGICDKKMGECLCNEGWKGERCDSQVHPGLQCTMENGDSFSNSPYDACIQVGCVNGCFGEKTRIAGCIGPDKTKKLGELCSIKHKNCVGELVCKKMEDGCDNGVGMCQPNKHMPPACVCSELCMPPAMCGSNGKSYCDVCHLRCAQSKDPSLTLKHVGVCMYNPDIYKASGEKAKEDWDGYSSNEIVKSSRVKQKRQNIGVGHIDGLRSNEKEELSFIDGSIEGFDMDRVQQEQPGNKKMKLKSSIHKPSIMNKADSIGMDDIEDMLLSGSMSEAGSEWKADDSPIINQKM